MSQKHKIELTSEECQRLEKIISAGTAPARTIRRAQVLLKSDTGPEGPGWKYAQIQAAYNVTGVTIARIKKRFVEEGLEVAIWRKKPDREYKRRLDGEAEAHLIALACSEPPEGRSQWSLRLLGSKLVELEIVDGISPETIRTTLKKTNSSPG